MTSPDSSSSVAELRSPHTIRQRCERVLEAGLADRLTHFAVDPGRLAEAARETAAATRARYPDLAVPIHGRMRHFQVGGVDHAARLLAALSPLSPRARAGRLIDVIVVSVLLDAGSGPDWRYHESGTGQTLARSEGLAVASLRWLQTGALSERGEPYAVDAAGLCRVTEGSLGDAFQVRPDNPLSGTAGRVSLLRCLGAALAERTELFGPDARPGGMLDALAGTGVERLPAVAVLSLLLDGLSEIWPGRLRLGGVALGDVYRHRLAGGTGASEGLLPFHKLSQWLTYSLVEPFALAGVTLTDLEVLTGLSEYRNGGLFVDTGVLALKDPAAGARAHAVDSELVVEWRALTLSLLDRLLPLVQAELGLSDTPERLPLSAMLEGGSWAAGRALAARRRPDGGPPIRIVSDGTVF